MKMVILPKLIELIIRTVKGVCLCVQFIKDGETYVQLLDIMQLDQFDAQCTVTSFVAQQEADGLDSLKIMIVVRWSKCNVRVSALLLKEAPKNLNRYIPYVHCFNHQLCLVIVYVLEKSAKIRQLFGILLLILLLCLTTSYCCIARIKKYIASLPEDHVIFFVNKLKTLYYNKEWNYIQQQVHKCNKDKQENVKKLVLL